MGVIDQVQAVKRAKDQLAAKGVPTYVAPSLRKRYNPERNTHNWNPDLLRHLRAGLGRAAAGGSSSWVVIGDSGSAGCTNGTAIPAEFARLQSWPIAARDYLAARGIPTAGTGFVRCLDNAYVDPRWVVTAGTWASAFKAYLWSSTVSSQVTFTSDRPGSFVDIWYADSTAVMTVALDGATTGSGFITITGGGTNIWKRATLYNVTVNVGSTIAITVTTVGSGAFLSGVEVFRRNSGLSIHNLSQSGSKAALTGQENWVDLTTTAAPSWALGATYLGISGTHRPGGKARQIVGATTATAAALGSTTTLTTADIGREIIMDQQNAHYFPVNTYITDLTDSTHAVTSQAALGTSTGIVTYIDRNPDAVFIDIGANDAPGLLGNPTYAQVTAAIETIATQYPASSTDIILMLSNQKNPASIPDANWEAFALAMFDYAEQANRPLIDLRHRFGNYSTVAGNFVSGDNGGHLLASGYMDIGRAVSELVLS
jgi:lysophospholipase L1-like esterase